MMTIIRKKQVVRERPQLPSNLLRIADPAELPHRGVSHCPTCACTSPHDKLDPR